MVFHVLVGALFIAHGGSCDLTNIFNLTVRVYSDNARITSKRYWTQEQSEGKLDNQRLWSSCISP